MLILSVRNRWYSIVNSVLARARAHTDNKIVIITLGTEGSTVFDGTNGPALPYESELSFINDA